jgi:hypothetical protein
MENSFLLTRRSAATLLGAALFSPTQAVAATKSTGVFVELFTSQGCSSCPPADKLAAELAKDPETLIVSFNVDYWDYLGWRDTLAKPEFSQRQYDYAKQRGDGSVYTPQMVVNGAQHAVGSNRLAVANLTQKSQRQKVALKLAMNKHDITVEVPAFEAEQEATLWLLAIDREVMQKIERGENAGEAITYINVVRNLVPAAMLKGEPYKGTWMRDTVMLPGCTHCIAVLQQHKVGPVLGWAKA